jgi:hypothetical protein
MRVADTFKFLAGAWSLTRTIADYESGQRGSFRGMAQLVASRFDSDSRATYEELGRLCFGSYEGTARRRLIYISRSDGTLLVNFVDNRRFIDFDLRAGAWHALHECGDDQYELDFHVWSTDVIKEHWRVRGPTTDYEAWTTCRRVSRPVASDAVTSPRPLCDSAEDG